MTNRITHVASWITSHWVTSTVIALAFGVAATCGWRLESAEAGAKRVQRKKKKELQALADKISTYACKVHQRYPTGDVVVSERDLAEQLRKQPDSVARALNLLLGERKVQKAPLDGYWKLNGA